MEEKKQKSRILCLHGHQTNSKIMEMQTKEWQRFFKDELEFEYLNGKHKLEPEEVIDVRVKKLQENGFDTFTWFKFLTENYYDNVISDLSHVSDYINNHGPYDGIMGFSQGGAVAHKLLQLVLEKRINMKYMPKFIILICAPMLGPSESIIQLNIPSIHYVSEEDELYDRQILTTAFYKNPIILSHSYGHRVPKLTPREVKTIKQFISSAIKQSSKDNIIQDQQSKNVNQSSNLNNIKQYAENQQKPKL